MHLGVFAKRPLNKGSFLFLYGIQVRDDDSDSSWILRRPAGFRVFEFEGLNVLNRCDDPPVIDHFSGNGAYVACHIRQADGTNAGKANVALMSGSRANGDLKGKPYVVATRRINAKEELLFHVNTNIKGTDQGNIHFQIKEGTIC